MQCRNHNHATAKRIRWTTSHHACAKHSWPSWIWAFGDLCMVYMPAFLQYLLINVILSQTGLHYGICSLCFYGGDCMRPIHLAQSAAPVGQTRFCDTEAWGLENLAEFLNHPMRVWPFSGLIFWYVPSYHTGWRVFSIWDFWKVLNYPWWHIHIERLSFSMNGI